MKMQLQIPSMSADMFPENFLQNCLSSIRQTNCLQSFHPSPPQTGGVQVVVRNETRLSQQQCIHLHTSEAEDALLSIVWILQQRFLECSLSFSQLCWGDLIVSLCYCLSVAWSRNFEIELFA